MSKWFDPNFNQKYPHTPFRVIIKGIYYINLRGLTIREYLFIFFRITIGNGKLIPTWKNHAPLRLSSKVFNLTPLPPGKPCVIIEVNKIVSERRNYTLYIPFIFIIYHSDTV